MNRTTFPETPAGNHCPDMTVLERQRASHKRQLQQQRESCPDYFGPGLNSGGTFCMTSQGLMVADVMKLDPDTYNSWPDLGWFGGYGVNYGIIPKMPGHKPPVPLPPVAGMCMSMQVPAQEKVKESVLVDGKSGQAGDESLGKRKFDKLNIIKTEDDENGEKKMKGYTDKAESKLTAQSNNDCKNNNNKVTNSKENAKNSHVQKPDYIHVRARRGQATDSHSLAERVRREKISERMKFLQDLVPGCNKMTGKAGMLDEIINYVQSLQRQVEFLSMKLAVVNPRLDVDIDSLFAKEITPACTPNFPSTEMPSDLPTQGFLQFNPTNQLVSHTGLALGVNPNLGIWRTISAPLPTTEKFLESSNFPQMQAPSAIWEDINLQNLYNVEFQQGRTMPFPSQQYTGSLETGNMKIEMGR